MKTLHHNSTILNREYKLYKKKSFRHLYPLGWTVNASFCQLLPVSAGINWHKHKKTGLCHLAGKNRKKPAFCQPWVVVPNIKTAI